MVAGLLLIMTFSVAMVFVVYKLVRKLLKKHAKKWFKFSDERTTELSTEI